MSIEGIKQSIMFDLSTAIISMRNKRAMIMFPNANGVRVMSFEEYVEYVIEKVYTDSKDEK